MNKKQRMRRLYAEMEYYAEQLRCSQPSPYLAAEMTRQYVEAKQQQERAIQAIEDAHD